ncbi:hypothetical protein [Pararcticibacter amylolyticus]|uniref:Uncharacterized protein n=1 Tax=Pararcticibacter amylolyticus TaxID=2173175 RepID=A0A2U2PLN5_9SPHI|nr:hypothetical protein [Pararcticibacter amylolyticus]PWG82238.1 hypothetical protein DDR33_04300 [Pararcticibacter amylolyticus]
MNKLFRELLVISFVLSVVSCSSDQPKEPQKPSVKVVLPKPFSFHKAIAIKPGLTFDVVSWGRGSEQTGAYLILRSDSADMKYRSTSGELEGKVTDAWNMDMDSDGNPEIFIEARTGDKENPLNIYVYEFDDNGSAREIRFPDLTSSTKKTYRGKDSIYVREGALFREFPLYEEADTAGIKPTGKKVLEYSLRGSTFSVKTVD